MKNRHIGELINSPIVYTLLTGWNIVKIKLFSIATLALILTILAYAATIFQYLTGLQKSDTFYGFSVVNILFLINLTSSFLTHLLFFSVATYVGKIFINVNDINDLKESIQRGDVLKFIFRRFPIAFGVMSALTLIFVPLVIYVIDIRELNFFTVAIWLLFSYFYFLVQYRMILSRGFIKGFLSIFTLIDPKYIKRAFSLRYIRTYSFYLILFNLYYGVEILLSRWKLSYVENQEILVAVNVFFLLFITVTLPIASVLASYEEGDQEDL
ncbi:MAG TPA: hypothetical protein ENL00_01035 [Nitratifractor sp.]|nr:hypothetical protein [Nitratifractor sp.]HHD74396.1 hypothetical protein [Nitratifractor sp.]